MPYVLPSEKSPHLWEDQSHKSYSPWNRAGVRKFTVVTLPIRLCASNHTNMNAITLHNQHDLLENMPPFITKLNAEDVSRSYGKVILVLRDSVVKTGMNTGCHSQCNLDDICFSSEISFFFLSFFLFSSLSLSLFNLRHPGWQHILNCSSRSSTCFIHGYDMVQPSI